MFRTVPLFIIRSFSVYTQQWYISYSFVDIHNCCEYTEKCTCFGQFLRPSSGIFHCTHSNDIWHIVLLTYTTVVCTLKTVHVSDSNSVHHQEFFTLHTGMVYVIQLSSRIRTEIGPDPARKPPENLYDIYHCCVYSAKLLMMDT